MGSNAVQTRFTYYVWNVAEQGGKLQRIFSQRPAQGGQQTIMHQDLWYDYDRNGNIETIQDYKNGAPSTQMFAMIIWIALWKGE